ncbi:hypothetical protein AVEN_34373-1 [Araneus ventricosus]|uniref:Uncharacterized protein n=1 Tax=Araneus ventricosus TaxID=182803 RepID=A0A4Y2G5J7_ARAVE|nr:hypothetical protein AVEN_34373-1 [Araneus ventricosus]
MTLLPPTEAAAHQHFLGVYHQIQHWLGNKKRHEDWDRDKTMSGLKPVKTLKPLHPTLIYTRHPASTRWDAGEIAAVGRPVCFVQCYVFIVGTTAITGRFK